MLLRLSASTSGLARAQSRARQLFVTATEKRIVASQLPGRPCHTASIATRLIAGARGSLCPSIVGIGRQAALSRAMASAADAPADGAAAAAAAAADDGVPLALTDEVKQQFDEKLLLTAIRVPKQATSQYMRRLSK